MDSNTEISVKLFSDLHRIAFYELYDWAGKWRTIQVTVGQLVPPEPKQVPQLMYQFADNLNFKVARAKNREEHLECLVFAHYEFVRIHPFTNGNGRTGRMLMNILAMKFGYRPLELYYREGDGRKIYIEAMKAADQGNAEPLKALIRKELIAF